MKSAGPTSHLLPLHQTGFALPQSAAMQSQRLSYAASNALSCRRLLFRTHGDIFCHQAPSEVVDQVMNVRHGLSHREATATDLPVHCLPMTFHWSTYRSLTQGEYVSSQLAVAVSAGIPGSQDSQWGVNLDGREIDPIILVSGQPKHNRAKFAEADYCWSWTRRNLVRGRDPH